MRVAEAPAGRSTRLRVIRLALITDRAARQPVRRTPRLGRRHAASSIRSRDAAAPDDGDVSSVAAGVEAGAAVLYRPFVVS